MSHPERSRFSGRGRDIPSHKPVPREIPRLAVKAPTFGMMLSMKASNEYT